jgi:hypothetical protein
VVRKGKNERKDQAARFREAAKEVGADAKAFDKAFNKIVPVKAPKKR